MSRQLFWITSAAIVLSVPLVPDDMKISVSMDAPAKRKTEKPYNIVTASCSLKNKYINSQGLQICEYRCDAGDNQIIYKTSMPNLICREKIQEQIKQTKR